MVSATDIVKKVNKDLYVLREAGHTVNGVTGIRDTNKFMKLCFMTEKYWDWDEFTDFGGNILIIEESIMDRDDFSLDTNRIFSIMVSTNPRLAFSRVIKEFFYDRKRVYIHPNAIVNPTAKIGAGTRIHANVTIYDNVVIGRNCKIKAGAVIGGTGFGYDMNESGEFEAVPHIGTVVIGDNVDIGANTCIDRGTLSDTIIRSGVKIDNNVHIAHNVFIDENTLIIANAMVAGSVRIGKNCWIAPGSNIIDNIEIGDNAVVGIGAVVIRSVNDNEVVVGNPAKVIRINGSV